MAVKTQLTGLAEYGQNIKALFVGDYGAGKTLLSSTFPNPYYISAEGGLMSVARKFLPFAVCEKSDDLREVLAGLKKPSAEERASALGSPYGRIDTIVVDTMDEVQKILMKERVRSTKKEAFVLQDYGWLNEQMQALIRAFRNLDMHVVFTCHLGETTDQESGVVTYKPGLAGQSSGYITGSVDLALLLRSRSVVKVVEKDTVTVIERYIQTTPDAKHSWIKDRSGRLPSEFPINFEDDYSRFHAAIYGGIEAEFKTLQDRAKTTLKEISEIKTGPDPLKPAGDDSEFEDFKTQLSVDKVAA